jgi:hypothetical protein
MRTIAALALLCGALATTPAGAQTTTAVRGILVRGPVTPVCVEARPCDAPVAGATIVFSRGGSEAARVTTNRLGHFALRLRAGAYGIKIVGKPLLERLSPRGVRVLPSGRVWLRLELDTGIRTPGPVRG